jgi:hypothetical protein
MSVKLILPALALALALAFLPGVARGVADGAAPLENLIEVGRGEMRWFGMDIYDARLLSSEGRYDAAGAAGPLALAIVYRRNISRDRLLSTTQREWLRLERELQLSGRTAINAWLGELAEIWPDVTPGDSIIALVDPNGPTRFYGNDGLLGAIADPKFGPAFLGIWLHPETRAADLRAALLGAPR